jgi:hypothetical protein
MQTRTPPAPAGWYDDTSRPGGQRYWDGQQWTDDFREPEMNESEHDFAQTVALANGRTLRVVADALDSVRLEEWQTDMAPTYSVVLTNRDMYNLWNAMVEALRRTHIHEGLAAPTSLSRHSRSSSSESGG